MSKTVSIAETNSCEVSGGIHHRFSNQGLSSFFSEPVGSFHDRHLRRAATLLFSLLTDAASISQSLQEDLSKLKRSDVPLFDRQTFSASRHPFALWGSKPPQGLQEQRLYEFSESFVVKPQSLLVSADRCKRVPTPRYLLSATPAPYEFASGGGPGSNQCFEEITLRSVQVNMVAFYWHTHLRKKSIRK